MSDKRLSAFGKNIELGDVIKRIDKPETRGVVVRIASLYKDRLLAEQENDVGVQLSQGCLRITNQFDKWEHIPKSEQKMEERFESWKATPVDFDNEEDFFVWSVMKLCDEISDDDYPLYNIDAMSLLSRQIAKLKGEA